MQVSRPEAQFYSGVPEQRIHHARRLDQRRSRIHRNRNTRRLRNLLFRRIPRRRGMHVYGDATVTQTSHTDGGRHELTSLGIEMPSFVAVVSSRYAAHRLSGQSAEVSAAVANPLVTEQVEDFGGDVRIFTAGELVTSFDHGHFRAEATKGLRQFQSDISTADDDEMLRHALEFERFDMRHRSRVG